MKSTHSKIQRWSLMAKQDGNNLLEGCHSHMTAIWSRYMFEMLSSLKLFMMNIRGSCYTPIELPHETYESHVGSGVQVTRRVGQGYCRVFISAKLTIDNVRVLQIVKYNYGSNNFATHSSEIFLTNSHMFNIFSIELQLCTCLNFALLFSILKMFF